MSKFADIESRKKHLVELIYNENTEKSAEDRPFHVVDRDCILEAGMFVEDVLKYRGLDWGNVVVDDVSPFRNLGIYQAQIAFSTELTKGSIINLYTTIANIASPSIEIESNIVHTFSDDERKFFDDLGLKYVEGYPQRSMSFISGVKPDINDSDLIHAAEKLAEIWRIKSDGIVSASFVEDIPLAQKFYEKQVDIQRAKRLGVDELQNELSELERETKAIESEISNLEKIPEKERTTVQEKKPGRLYEGRRGFYKEIEDEKSLIQKTKDGIKPEYLLPFSVIYKCGNQKHYVEFMALPNEKDMSKYSLTLISQSLNIEMP